MHTPYFSAAHPSKEVKIVSNGRRDGSVSEKGRFRRPLAPTWRTESLPSLRWSRKPQADVGKDQRSPEGLTEMVGEKFACLEELLSLEVVSSLEVFGLSIVYSSGKELT
jgi:hypothetical protein